MRVSVQFIRGEIRFTSELAKQNFLKRNDRKYGWVSVDDATTSEKRRYFEGCLVPVVFYTHPHAGWKSFKETREWLKFQFCGMQISDVDGKTIRIAKSTTELNNRQFGQFLQAVGRWLIENELCVEDDIDPERYKAWRDSAPAVGEIYPPMARLKMRYDAEHGGTV